MAEMSAPSAPDLNRAAQVLIEALDDMAALQGFRLGLECSINFTVQSADPANPAHFEALDALKVWRALAELTDAVQARRGVAT